MEGFKATDTVADHYDTNPAFAGVLNRAVPGFEYPDWSHLSIAKVWSRLSVADRQLAENALNGWDLDEKALTARQERFVSEHSGEQRSEFVRETVAVAGSEALALLRSGDEAAARKLLMETGLSERTVDLLLQGWEHESIEHEANEQPAVCCIVNALAHKTYVGRIVQLTDKVVWQEVEPGQIVEHEKAAFGDIPQALAESYFRVDTPVGELANPWANSWCVSYAGDGKASVKTAALMLLDGNSVKPNPFTGRVVSETGSRFVQENGNNVYSGHLKSMTGPLEIGKSYKIKYRGPMGKQVADVTALGVGVKHSVADKAGLDGKDTAGAVGDVPACSPVLLTRREAAHSLMASDALTLGVDIFRKLQVVVTPRDVADCLEEKRGNAEFSGRILDVNQESGLVVLSSGRQGATVHRLCDFAQEPVAGVGMDIKYRAGKITEAKVKGLAQGVER